MPDAIRSTPSFERWRVTLQPGECRAFRAEDWVDALVIIESGTLELETLTGHRERLQEGAIFWLVGLPLRTLRNPSAVPAVFAAVARCATKREEPP